VLVVEDGEIKETRPKSKIGEFLIYDGKHEAIISEELFNAARAKQGRNHRAKPKTKVRNPLASLLFCRCGRAMSLRTYKNPDGTFKSAPRLLCDGQTHCKTASSFYDDVIARISDALKDCIQDFEIRIQNDESDSIKLHTKLIKNLEKRLKELEAKEITQWEAQTSPDESMRMPAAVFQRLNTKLLAEKEEVNQALCKAYESMPDPVDYEEKLVRFKAALEALQDDNVPPLEKNKLLKQCIERIDYSREKPQRLSSQRKRVTINGKRTTTSPLQTGANWTNPPIELDIKLKTD
jgi:hypothetical protein